MTKYTMLRAFLYSLAAFLAPLADEIGPILAGDQWPSPQKLVACFITGTLAVTVTLRAYFDGSAERARAGKEGCV